MSFRFVPFLAFVIPLYLLYQRGGLYNTHIGLILAYQLITLPFTIWMLRSLKYIVRGLTMGAVR
jgi:multiple sugar transport system permease protein